MQRHSLQRIAQASARCVVFFIAGLMAISFVGCKHASTPAPNLAALSVARDASRFSVIALTDSTVTFRHSEVRWLRPGMRGLVVDPALRDALIARLTIQRVDTAGTIARIAGGVSPVALTHVVLFEKPAVPWWRDKRFWLGAGAGVLAGFVGTSATR